VGPPITRWREACAAPARDMGISSRIRGAALAGLLAGGLACAAGCFGGGRGPAVITSNDPASRIPAIKKAVGARQTATAPQLVRSLESDDPAVRLFAIHGLRDLTGETFGYLWYAGDSARERALRQWKTWLKGNVNGNGGGNDGRDGDRGGQGLAGGRELEQR
jgi:hypothetical protein